ncbi:ferritin-like domain-containing protein [Pontibacter sp. 172403-2]|uniref:ferritin-like domain-containing protein n=1 Tax=Pontibacter rufus TaxID=2791028 RepID=UPI0018AF66AF|nr:ferritin-like domain-containing protein [Pontibacter sp. 172403-2]MBF9254557.1 ferritin-like domain-containing protein [Pontibacter sp. 172403-2]
MNIIKLFDSFNLDNKSEEQQDIYMSRKEVFRKMGGFAKNAALASLPLAAFTAMPVMAFAGTSEVMDVLKFALTLERLEYKFYEKGLSSGVIAQEDMNIFKAIRDHEKAHVEILETTIQSLGGNLEDVPGKFDFTAEGRLPSPFEYYDLFMALSQAFEDTGVRAYKGQAPNLMDNDALLTVALQIHSVEARHAAQIRRMRGEKGWISEVDGIEGLGYEFMDASMPVYAGEENTTHAGVNVTKVTQISANAVKEAWDEPLSKQAVVDIVKIFLVS